LVNPKDNSKELLETSEVAKLLFMTINNKNIFEDDNKQDSILAGSLRMLTTLDELFHSELKTNVPAMYSKEFLNFLLANGLWSREKPDDMSSENTDEVSFPLCKHGNTRKYAYKLVNQIFGQTNMNEIAKFMEPYIKSGSWRTNKRDKWFIQSSKLNQRNTYVGLVNLGCTCYMNSVMQQLFMCPQFRNFICTSNDPKRHSMPIEDNVLYNTKYLFANLIKSQMPSYNPVVFFNSIKDFNGEPMPTNEQRDVDEFLNIYMDKIEQNILGTEDDKYLKSIFGGAFAQELICKDCPHRSSREEPYMALSLEIKNKSNITEALDLFIQGEMLEGDNAYYCER
jgi:ubiquitin C-terminal hydrolase